MDLCGVFVQCSSVQWRGEGLFLFLCCGPGTIAEFLHAAASYLMMFAPHPHGLGAMLTVSARNQVTRKMIF